MPRISSRSTKHAIDKLRERTPEFTEQDVKDVLPLIDTGVPARDPRPAPSETETLSVSEEATEEQARARAFELAAQSRAARGIKASDPAGDHVDGYKLDQKLTDAAYRDAGIPVEKEGYYSQYADLDW